MAEQEDEEWRTLLAHHEMLQAAVSVAWNALLAAYRPTADGGIAVDNEALIRYQKASALRLNAEAALLQHLKSKRSSTSG